jgi:hypothetical protein
VPKVNFKRVEVPVYIVLNDGEKVYLDEEFYLEYIKLVFEVSQRTKFIEKKIKDQQNLPDNVILFPRKG